MTTSLGELTAILAERPISPGSQAVILLLLVAGLAAKSAVFPLHGWLPAAIAEAPTATGVVLTGTALQVGGYGLVRFGRGLLPDAVAACSIWLSWLFVVGIIFGAIMAMVQSDLRRLLGYACVSQMGLCMLGLCAADNSAVCGGILKMIAGGLAVGGLLSLLAVGQRGDDSSRIESLGTDRWRRNLFVVFVVFVLLLAAAGVGMPGTAGFIGMRPILSSLSGQSGAVFVLSVVGVALGVCYTLKLARQMLASRGGSSLVDRPSTRQILAAGLLSVFILWIGLAQGFFVDLLRPTDIPHAVQSTTHIE